MTETVIGSYLDRADADAAVSELQELGYPHQDISVIMKDDHSTTVINHDKTSKVIGSTTAGATAGGVIAAIAGLLVGIGAIAIPGIGALFIGGPLAATLGLTGAGATAVSAATTGVLAGGVAGALVGIGLPEDVAKTYETQLKEGAVIIAVPVNSTLDHRAIEKVFQSHNAQQIRTLTHDNS